MDITFKNEQEIQAMREGGQILATILNELKKESKAGITTKQLDEIADTLFQKFKVTASFKGYNGFPANICTTINEEVVHGIPNQTVLQIGDILTIDCGVYHKGLHTDSAITFGIGPISKEASHLIEATNQALWEGIHQIKPGNKIGDISFAIGEHLKKNNITVIDSLVGHGLGKNLHEPPQIPNQGKKGSGPALKPGMTIAIEPITSLGTRHIETLEDNWTIVTQDNSLSCQQEHTVLVTNSGFEVLTEIKSN